jgi:thioredoxin 1
MATITVTDDSFEADVLKAEKPVLVDFWAEWCAPCKMIGPSLEELSDELADTLTIVKLNTEDNPDTPSKLGIRGIPTLFLYKNGEIVAKELGIGNIQTKAKMRAWIESVIGTEANVAEAAK